MKMSFRGRFRWSVGSVDGRPASPPAEDRPASPLLDGAARVSAALDVAMRISLVIAGVVVFGVAVLILATMDDASRAQGGRVYVAVAGIFIIGGLDGLYGRLEYRRRPFWMEGPGEIAYRRYLLVSAAVLLAAAAILIALAIYLP